MNTKNTFLKYKNGNGEEILVSVADILHIGPPINGCEDGKEGDEMELVSDSLYDENGLEIQPFAFSVD